MSDSAVTARPAADVLGALFDHASVGLAELAPNGRVLRVNRHLRQMLGYSDGASLPAMLHDLTHPDDRDVDLINVELMASGTVDGYRQDRLLRRCDGSFLWVDSAVTAIRGIDGNVDRLAGVIHDISRYKEAEQRQQTLLGEMAHRGRNSLAIVQALARHTLTGALSLSEAYAAFRNRLNALSQSLNGLTHMELGGITLDELLRSELESVGARATLEGPAVMMTPNAGQTFALIVHELTINATKYGALSTVNGVLSVTWSVTGTGDAARFLFEWREADGPSVTPPLRRGFGTFLTVEAAGADFDCEPVPSYGAKGFEYRFDAPLARVGALAIESPVRRRLKDPIVCALYDSWVLETARAGGLSDFARFDWARFAATGAMTVGKVETDGSVRITRVGRALTLRLGRTLSGDASGAEHEMEELARTLELYRRCVLRAAPCHEYLQFDFGGGEPRAFERLVVPFAESPGGPVSHLIGMAIFTDNTDDPADSAIGTGGRLHDCIA